MEKNYELKSDWGVATSKTNPVTGDVVEIRLTKMSWFGKGEKWDLRKWDKDGAKQGVVIGNDDDLRKVKDLLVSVCEQLDRG